MVEQETLTPASINKGSKLGLYPHSLPHADIVNLAYAHSTLAAHAHIPATPSTCHTYSSVLLLYHLISMSSMLSPH